MENRWETQRSCTSIDSVWLRGWAAGFHVSSPAQPGRICFLGLCTRTRACVCVCVPAGAGMCAWCVQTCVRVAWVVWVCACLCLGLHADGEDGDLALITQQHTAPPRGRLCTGMRTMWCELPWGNLLLNSASLHQAGIWPCCPHWGLRTGLGVKKLGGKKNQRAQPGCLLHQCNFNF